MPNYSGLYDGVFNTPHALLSNSIAKGQDMTVLTKAFARRAYGRAKTRELLVTLINGASGDAALASHVRVLAVADRDNNVQGGVRAVETFKSIDRNTAAADVTQLVTALEAKSQPTTYVADRSGNGGGGKLTS